MKHVLLVVAAAVLFVNTLVIPTAAKTDGGGNGTNCGQVMCKP